MSKQKKGLQQGIFSPKNPSKYCGAYPICFRSSWERIFCVWCDKRSSVVKWSSESTIIPYYDPTTKRKRRYFVDFKVVILDPNTNTEKTYLIEIKPDKQTRKPDLRGKSKEQQIKSIKTWAVNEAKWKYAESYCQKRGYEFKIVTEYELGLKKKTTPKPRKKQKFKKNKYK